jgi:hypothetical protein
MPFLPILLSNNFVSAVKVGDIVTVGQVLAKKTKTWEVSINLSDELAVPPHTVIHYVKKNPGDTFDIGEVLALKKNLWGKIVAQITSKSKGIVSRFERDTGELFLIPFSEDFKENEVYLVSPIEGKVALCNNEKILIDTDKNFLEAKKGIGGQDSKEIFVLDSEDTVELFNLNSKTIGKIVIGHFFPKDTLIKSVSMGISAIIGTKIMDSDIAYLQKRQMSIPIVEVSIEDINKVKHWHGKNAFISGEGKTVILLQ